MKRKFSKILGVGLTLALLTSMLVTAAPVAAATINVPGDYLTIQLAVDAADPDDIISVATGTYTEQLTINESLTLAGAGAASTIIQAPGTLTGDKAIVTITGAGVNVEFSGFTVTGPGPGTSNSIFAGIFVRDGANANIHDNHILDIRDEPFGGGQEPHGIWVGSNAKTTTGTATIKDNTISGYQKGGIAVEGTGSTATIGESGHPNTIIGAGPLQALAQDGIRVAYDAGPVDILDNNIEGNAQVDGTGAAQWGGAGIYLIEAAHDVVVRANYINANRFGILIQAWEDTPGASVDGVTIENNQIMGNSIGIQLQQNLFDEASPAPINVHIIGNDIASTSIVLPYEGLSSWGISVHARAAATNYAHFNNIAGTPHYGVEYQGSDMSFDATNNWWGDVSGPYHVTNNPQGMGDAVSDNVNFIPCLWEPYSPTAVDMDATYPAPVIGISVDWTKVSFGEVTPGVSAPGDNPVTVTNTGTVDVDLSTSIINESPLGVYTAPSLNGLTIGGTHVSTWAGLAEVGGDTGPLPLILMVPLDTPPGTYTATLVFWAEERP